MKLLLISIVLLILHIQFYRMEPNPSCTFKSLSPDDSNSEAYKISCETAKAIKLPSCSRGSATQIANASAEEAKAASEAQAAAAQNASQQVKLFLAHRALAAACATRCLVRGKQAVVERLAKKIPEVEAVVEQIKASLETSHANVEVTSAALKMVEKHNATIEAVMDQMRSSLEDLDTLRDQLETDLEEKTQMVAKAKELDDRLSLQVAEAKAEYEVMKVKMTAALKAQEKSSSPQNVTASPGNSSSYGQCYVY